MLGKLVQGTIAGLFVAGIAAAAEPVAPAAPALAPTPSQNLTAPQYPAGSYYRYGDSYWMMASPAMTPAEFSLTPGYPRNLGGVAPGMLHERYPFYSYRRPWYTPGPASQNVTIVW